MKYRSGAGKWVLLAVVGMVIWVGALTLRIRMLEREIAGVRAELRADAAVWDLQRGQWGTR